MKKNFIRHLTPEEKETFYGAIVLAQSEMPHLIDIFLSMRPFYDSTAKTAYVDADIRVGLSDWFFTKTTPAERAFVVTHEALHVLNAHVIRTQEYELDDAQISADLEINTTLLDSMKLTVIKAPQGILTPKRYGLAPRKSMEYYLKKLNAKKKRNPDDIEITDEPHDYDEQEQDEDQEIEEEENATVNEGESDSEDYYETENKIEEDGDEGSSSEDSSSDGDESQEGDGNQEGEGAGEGAESDSESSGDGEGSESGSSGSNASEGYAESSEAGYECDQLNDERKHHADEAGIEKAGSVEQINAISSAIQRIEEEIKSSSGYSENVSDALAAMVANITAPKMDWTKEFARLISQAYTEAKSGHEHLSYKRVSRRSQGDFIMPGRISYEPTLMFATDISGSMGTEKIEAAVSEAEGIVAKAFKTRRNMSFFAVSTSVSQIRKVRSFKELDLSIGGGTIMSVGYRYVTDLPRKDQPDVFVLATDAELGSNDWQKIAEIVSANPQIVYIMLVISEKDGLVPEEIKGLIKILQLSEF